MCVAAQPGGSLESDSVVRGSCRTSERVKGREGGRAAALRRGDVAPLVFIAGWVAGR